MLMTLVFVQQNLEETNESWSLQLTLTGHWARGSAGPSLLSLHLCV